MITLACRTHYGTDGPGRGESTQYKDVCVRAHASEPLHTTTWAGSGWAHVLVVQVRCNVAGWLASWDW